MDRLSICYLTIEPARTSGSGASIRVNRIETALRQNATVTRISLEQLSEERASPPAGGSSLGWQKLTPTKIEMTLDDALIEQVMSRVHDLKPDMVLLESVLIGRLVEPLKAAGHYVVLDCHNVESTLFRDVKRQKRFLADFRFKAQFQRAQNREAEILSQVDGVWACSQEDIDRLQRLAPDLPKAAIVPNPVPAQMRFDPVDAQHDPTTLLFVGHLSYAPNVFAARRLIKRIMPSLRRRLPNAQLIVAGRTPHHRLRSDLRHAPEGVRLIADPESLRPFYEEATVVVVPLETGGGTRIKVLEAIAFGVPIVASEKAVEGLGLSAGIHFLQAETDADFVQAVERLAKDQALSRQLCRASLELIQTTHSDAAHQQAIEKALARCGPR